MKPDDQAVRSATNGSPQPRGNSKASGTRKPLTLERIVGVAIDLIESEGPDALSMRRLAMRLGSSTMATYHHVADRQALMEAIAQRLLTELDPVDDQAPVSPSHGSEPGWAELVRAHVTAYLALSRRHPATFAALLSSRPTALVSKVEGITSDLVAAGLDEPSARLVVRTTVRYLMGTVMGEGAAAQAGLSRAEMDESFEFGLDVLLDGMTRRVG